MVLLVACVNVAVRVAIGASRARLVRQWLTESVLLGILGSIGALLVTLVSTPLLHTFVIPEAVDLSVNARVLGFTLAVGVGSGRSLGSPQSFRRSDGIRPRHFGIEVPLRAVPAQPAQH
jgi:putative ABC transport system permease protein